MSAAAAKTAGSINARDARNNQFFSDGLIDSQSDSFCWWRLGRVRSRIAAVIAAVPRSLDKEAAQLDGDVFFSRYNLEWPPTPDRARLDRLASDIQPKCSASMKASRSRGAGRM
jgi:hypothetical protein